MRPDRRQSELHAHLLHQCGKKKMLPGIFMKFVCRAGGWSVDLLITDCEELENLSAFDTYVTRFKHQEVAQKESCRSHVQTNESLKLLDFPQTPRGKILASGNPEQDANEEEGTLFEDENGKDFWTTSGDLKYRHHEVL